MGRILVIGSVAAQENGFDLGRGCKDIDVIATYEDALAYLKTMKCSSVYPSNQGNKLIGMRDLPPIEVEIAWTGSTSEKLLNLVWDQCSTEWTVNESGTLLEGRYAPVNALYALKMSHRYKRNSPHFHKTMSDIRAMRAAGAEIPESFGEWFRERERETYDYGHPKLNQNKANFFSDDGVNYIYDHDSIHEAIKLKEQPAYNYFKPDTNEVFCSKEMFFACDEEIRLSAVYEESCVLALERSIVPHPGVLTPREAFAKALEKVCTSITSGWFREYAWESYHEVLKLYDTLTEQGRNYVTLFESGLENGVIKPYERNGGE